MEKSFKLILGFVTIIFTSFFINAETEEGVWKIHTVFNENRTRVVDAGDKVYCVTENSLNVYNKTTGEFEGLTKQNRLSDFFVKDVYYNKGKNYLVVAYSNYNIDVLLENGTTINIPDLKNLTTVADRSINGVTFGENGIYVASKIGYIVIDDKDFKITKSAYLGSNVQSIAEVGDKFILADGSNTYFADKSKTIKKVSEMTNTSLAMSGTIMPIDESHFFLNGSALYLVTISETGKFTKTKVSTAKVVDVQATANGFIAVGGTSFTVTNKYYAFDKNGNKTVDIAMPTALANTLLTSQENDGSLWRLGAKGLQKVSLETSTSTVKTLTDELIPSNCIKAKRVGALAYNKNNGRLYVTSGGHGVEAIIGSYNVVSHISSYDGFSWKNEAPTDLKGYKFRDPYEPLFDLNEPNTFYVGTWFEGIFKIKNNEIIAKYDWSNSPLLHALNKYFCHVPCMKFDSQGNLWTVQHTADDSDREINVLKKDAINKTDDLVVGDWITPNIKTRHQKRLSFIIDKNDNKVLYDGSYDGLIKIFKNDESMQNVETRDFTYFQDQDGKKITWSLILDMEEDKNGMVWVATTWGIFGMNADNAFDADFRVYKPKDEANSYILDNVYVTRISVDEYNRKWVGTLDDGMYLLNEDCSKVLKHFNTSNSCFPNEKVISICWNPKTQSVFVGFNGALLEYKPENIDSYTDIIVAPNSVTPDFQGVITFDKVPVNSTLYVKNTKGEIVKTLQATSSKVYWNCLNEENEYVETGKYTLSVKLNNQNQVKDNILQFSVIK